ncbi:hypothetical protein [Microbacterium sp. RU33B]|uniref:hypothetical protein n=1 Tax=Microbacterium sp. RU33B TaxID=1907390 RepID=UPI0009698896|nr:hypothetical protein [Microbacterium sp. RU33B]SIT87496.1 hypothetical protein SAMN05880545_2781 [Microbacterium sp. RU33B]
MTAATKGETVGRIAAWIVAVASVLSTVALVLVPLGGQLAAAIAWTRAQKDACLEGAVPCAMSTVPFGPWLAWWAAGWAAVILVALLVCWSPRRWWTPRGDVTPLRPGVFSTPEWFRMHAGAGFLIILLGFAVTAGRYSDMPVWGYGWGSAIALVTAVLATVCIRSTADRLDERTRAGLARGYAFWLFPSEVRLRARARAPHDGAAGPRAPGPRAAARRRERGRG